MITMHNQIAERLADTFGIRVGFVDDLIREIPASRENVLFTKLLNLASDSMSSGAVSEEFLFTDRITGLDLHNMDPYSLFMSVIYGPYLKYYGNQTRSVELHHILRGMRNMNDFYLAHPGGLILGMMSDCSRTLETSLAEIAVESLGIRPDIKITTGSVEGGDIIPAGDFILVGCGSGTSIEGIRELISSKGLSGEIAVVHEPVHPLVGTRDTLTSGHLDAYINFPREGLVVGDPMLLRSAQVEVFHTESPGDSLSDNPGNLLEYIRSKSLDLIELNTIEQLCNASGFLCVYGGECIAEDLNEKSPLILKNIRDQSVGCEGKYAALLNRAEHDYRQMRYDGSRMMDREFLSDYGVEFMYISGEGAVVDAGGVRRCVGIISRR